MERLNNAMVTRPPQRSEHETLEVNSRLSRSFAAKVAEIVTKARAGLTPQLEQDEFRFLVGQWVETLGGFVPEARLNDCYLHAARNRNSNFPMTATDICGAWKQIREAERLMPPIGSYEWSRAREVCGACNNTGTILVVKRHSVLGRDYTYAQICKGIHPA